MTRSSKPRYMRDRRRKKAKSCGKRRFRDHTEAVRELRRIITVSRRETVPARTYHCHLCKGWHLTSQA